MDPQQHGHRGVGGVHHHHRHAHEDRLTARLRRRNTMSTRTITGNLAADPEVVKAGPVSITKLRVIENTGEYRGGKFVAHYPPTSHFVEARFELGENAAASL